MAENKDSKPSTALNELDENENPSSLNISPSISTVNDSFKRINSESDKKSPGTESLYSPGDTLISASLSTSQKNALVDSGFHCENLDKIAPDLVNSSLCESVDNQIADDIHEEKQVSTTSGIAICSSNDNSLNISTDSSFNTLASKTTNISLLFECLTLNSAENAQSAELNASPDNIAPLETSNNQPMPTEVPFNDNFQQANLLNVDVNSNGSNTNISVSPDKSLQQPHLPDLNHVPSMESKVPLNETFGAANAVNVSMNTNAESLTNSSKTSLDDVFKCPLPVPESNNVPNINTSFDNVFPVETDDNLDGEEFQDAVQFFKDPSSFQVLENIGTSNASGSNMPRDSLYMNFDPLYKRVIQPTDVESVNVKDNASFDKESIIEICEMNNATNDHVISKHVRESLGIRLVSFDSPIKINSEKDSGLNIKSVKEEVCCKDSVENDQHMLDKQFHEPKSPNIKLECDSHWKSSSEANSEKYSGDLTKESFKEEICKVENAEPLVNKQAQESLGINLVSLDSPMVNIPEKENEPNKKSVEDICGANNVENDQGEVKKHLSDVHADTDSLDCKLGSNSPLKSNSDENSEKDSGDLGKESVKEEISEENQEIVNKHLARESLGDNLLSFESPIKCSFENVKTSSSENEHKLYTEEEFQQALKIYELTLQETYLKRQKKLEEEALKQGSETVVKLDRLTKLCKVLLETVTELASVASEQNVKIGELSTKVKNLESENEELGTNLKTTTEDLQSVENTFSDFHKRYVQSKDMLKTYKDNEDQLKAHIENLSKKLEEQEQMNAMLQVKMGEMVDKANAEVATAKKGGDAQLAVLKAQLKKSELKVSSLENDLKQTRIENDNLSSICDELMAKVSES